VLEFAKRHGDDIKVTVAKPGIIGGPGHPRNEAVSKSVNAIPSLFMTHRIPKRSLRLFAIDTLTIIPLDGKCYETVWTQSLYPCVRSCCSND
jgi:hypothetical protein